MPVVKETRRFDQAKIPVVCIGASAGGVEAFIQLFDHLPPDTGMAFVVISHLAPTHESFLTELVSKNTRMLVKEVVDGIAVRPNQIYVIPPNANMVIKNDMLRLSQRNPSEIHMPVDYFLRSLAEERGPKAIGVILSGTASDGALGIVAIKAAGGVTFAQDDKSAKYTSMPQHAIATGAVDLIMKPEDIARELARIGRHPYVTHHPVEKTDELSPHEDSDLKKILHVVRVSTNVDFTNYKTSTIRRRIGRRMALHQFEKMSDYLKYVQTNTEETNSLYNELLIPVTNFFRDPEAFEALKKKVLPIIMKNRPRDEPIRIWVPGCSSGEEVYSIAICVIEFLAERSVHVPIQIFATDVNEVALQKARVGHYIENIAQDVSRDRLRRFFLKTERGYEILKSIRDLCIFAKQDITKDPPFSRVDLISCRNVLIYLGGILQKKVLPILHYALKPKGFLLLGSSESISGFIEYFETFDKKNRICVRKPLSRPSQLPFPTAVNSYEYSGELETLSTKRGKAGKSEIDIQREADHLVLNQYAPAGVIIDDNLDIIQFRGDTSPYLVPAPGRASFHLLKMSRDGLLGDLQSAIREVKKTKSITRKKNVQIKNSDGVRRVNIEIIPIKPPQSGAMYYLVLFENPTQTKRTSVEAAASKRSREGGPLKLHNETQQQLKQELIATREYLQAIIEEQEATNEELRSANEEALSSNEELQSTNEELETAKEELQSANEELTTVNEEIQSRNIELSQLNNDLTNLLSTVNLPILMLGSDLRIRRFTPMAEKLMNLIPTDIGRPIKDINSNLLVTDLEEMLIDVIDNITTKEREVHDKDGRRYIMRVRPYKTPENRIEGAVMILLDIDKGSAGGGGKVNR